MYNILSVPYMNMRISEMNEKKQKKVEITDLRKKSKFVEYPEEIFESSEKSTDRQLTDLLKNKEFKEKFFEGVTYEKDPVEESE